MPATDMLADPRLSLGQPVYAAPRAPVPLASIIYRSRAVGALPDSGLQALVRLAQTRNRREDITGIVVFDRNRFFQWLEGPAEGIGRVLSSIRRDPRHTDVEVLTDTPTPRRRFSGWDMKLAVGPDHCPSQADVLSASPALLDDLHRDADGVAAGLGALAPFCEPARPSVARQIEALVRSRVLPELLLRHGADTESATAKRRDVREARRLVPLLLAADEAPAAERIADLCGAQDRPVAAGVRLCEAIALKLAALWADDLVSELDIAMAACRLQSALRWLLVRSWLPARPAEIAPRALVATQPGESHTLGSALVAAMLDAEGWRVHRCDPENDAELQEAAASEPFDAVSLSLSPVFRRDHRLPQMAASLAGLREALAKRPAVLITGGRVFAERPEAAHEIGADAVCPRADRAAATILHAMRARRIG